MVLRQSILKTPIALSVSERARLDFAGCTLRDNVLKVPRRHAGSSRPEAKVWEHMGAAIAARGQARLRMRRCRFEANGGDAVRSRPCGAFGNIAGCDAAASRPVTAGPTLVRGNVDQHRRPVSATVTRRQRVPFDWTVGSNVAAADKSLQERVDEMRREYRAMSADKEMGTLSILPDGADSTVCVVS